MTTTQFPIDIISCCENTEIWQLEALEHANQGIEGFSINDEGRAVYNDVIPRTEVFYNTENPNETKSLCLVRLQNQEQLDQYLSFSNIRRLGQVSISESGDPFYDFDTGLDEETYLRIRPLTPVQYGSYTHYPPFMFALFA